MTGVKDTEIERLNTRVATLEMTARLFARPNAVLEEASLVELAVVVLVVVLVDLEKANVQAILILTHL